ncbi:unnamed protein product, partial [Ectocarpus fasciculatus]
VKQPLLVLWINLDRSTGRRSRMQDMFATLERVSPGELNPVRIPAVGRVQVDGLLSTKNFSAPSVIFMDKFDDNTHNWQHHFRGEYLKTEAGCTLSHLSAIKEAYESGESIALIVEDDVVITEKFLLNWKNFVAVAPDDWQVLQMYSNNHAVMKHTGRLKGDGFLPWMADHYGTAAYLINRAGMKTLLDLAHADATKWSFPDRIVVADEFIYYYTVSYTALDPMVYIADSVSSIQKDTSNELSNRVKLSQESYAKKLAHPFHNLRELKPDDPSILIITTTKINNISETESLIRQFFTNLGIISRYAKVKYELLILLRLEDFRQDVIDAINPYLIIHGDKCDIHYKVQRSRFNKFRFVKQHIDVMGSYDYVLLVDSDLPFSGYPWAEFFKRQQSAKAVITGSVRESKTEGLIRNIHPGVRQWFRVFDGSWWKQPGNQGINYKYTDFIEQYFALLDGRFSEWYFNQALADDVLYSSNGEPTESDYGPDVMWCGAAVQWLNESADTTSEKYIHPCVLVPLVISHSDTKQISFSGGDVDKMHLRKQVVLFPKWTNYSYKFRSVLGGKR